MADRKRRSRQRIVPGKSRGQRIPAGSCPRALKPANADIVAWPAPALIAFTLRRGDDLEAESRNHLIQRLHSSGSDAAILVADHLGQRATAKRLVRPSGPGRGS